MLLMRENCMAFTNKANGRDQFLSLFPHHHLPKLDKKPKWWNTEKMLSELLYIQWIITLSFFIVLCPSYSNTDVSTLTVIRRDRKPDNTCINWTKPTYLHHIEIVWPCKDTQQKVSQFFLGWCKLPGPPNLTSWAQGNGWPYLDWKCYIRNSQWDIIMLKICMIL